MCKPKFNPFLVMQQLNTRAAWSAVIENGHAYIVEPYVKVSFWGAGESRTLQLIMLETAPVTAGSFPRYSFTYEGGIYSQGAAIVNLLSILDNDLEELVDVLSKLRFSENKFGFQSAEVFGLTIYRSMIPVLFVLNPFDQSGLEEERRVREVA